MGFRPFIYRLASRHGLPGKVDNRTDGVCVIAQGEYSTIECFITDIIRSAPPASKIKSVKVRQLSFKDYDRFSIESSSDLADSITEISPDIAVCTDCMTDIENDPARTEYPFVNCTNCGPRFTIIEALPYDRKNTSMKSFSMCRKCASEYNDISDRRFHAQPIACNSCGPLYLLKDLTKSISGIRPILDEVTLRINDGKSVAIKGMGGYFLMCDALNNDAVCTLRERKQRDAKPFAVMFRDITALKQYCITEEAEENELFSWRRPVVILRQKKHLADAVSNGLRTTGALLPYMAIHYLMFRFLKTPALVYTSGNISDEPIIIDDLLAEKRLMPVTDTLLTYNRDIINRADDSVIRIIDNKTTILRRSRGYVPRPVDLIFKVDGILSTGAEQKNSFCIGKERQAIMSQHIGDLKNLPAYEFFLESFSRFSELFRFKPEYIACDLHPEYLSTKYAETLSKELNIPLYKIQHHHAHIASCMAEYAINEKVIGISMDGTGYGTDGNTWGSEFMIADMDDSERYTHFDYIRMPGGDKAVDEPWRMAFSYLFNYFDKQIDYMSIPAFSSMEEHRLAAVEEMIAAEINSPLTSGAGRLFDAVSALIGLCKKATWDSEAPMRLESAINCKTDLYYPFAIDNTIVFADTFKEILKDMEKKDTSIISAKFHNTIAQVILQVSRKIRSETYLNKVVLSGGVFQNKYLLEKSLHLLTSNRFKVYVNHLVPSNDGGIALGQLTIASKRIKVCA